MIEFINGSTIKSIESQTNTNSRGNRSNFITTICYDTVEDKYVWVTLDIREPIDRFIPEWLFDEWLKRKETI